MLFYQTLRVLRSMSACDTSQYLIALSTFGGKRVPGARGEYKAWWQEVDPLLEMPLTDIETDHILCYPKQGCCEVITCLSHLPC